VGAVAVLAAIINSVAAPGRNDDRGRNFDYGNDYGDDYDNDYDNDNDNDNGGTAMGGRVCRGAAQRGFGRDGPDYLAHGRFAALPPLT
jgi:hypothetical protein